MDVRELYIDSVHHDFGGKTVLSGVYLSCKPGEVVGLLGRNGCGKTTLLRIIFGSLKPRFKFQRLGDQLIAAGYKTGEVAYLPQHNFIPRKLTVSEAINFLVNKHKDELLESPVIRNYLHKRLNNLSGGEVRLIECLLVLYSDAQFILLDEPFSQLSPVLAAEMQKHIISLKDKKGFIITDHYHEQVSAIATRIVLLHNGCNYSIKSLSDLILHGYLPAKTRIIPEEQVILK